MTSADKRKFDEADLEIELLATTPEIYSAKQL